MNELLDMGGYAIFVWSSYGIFFFSLIIFFLINISNLRKYEKIFNKKEIAIKNCDVVMTDKIISLNDKVNKKKKLKSFKNFKVDTKTMNLAKKDAIFLHCLPRGNEVTEEVFLGKQSKVWQQALNRVYVQKSILLYCFGKLR